MPDDERQQLDKLTDELLQEPAMREALDDLIRCRAALAEAERQFSRSLHVCVLKALGKKL
jgi:hypothetical protein